MSASPFLKWVGGKTQIIDKLFTFFPKQIHGNYYEPFVGGGSVLIRLLMAVESGEISVSGSIFASDANSKLISTFVDVQRNAESLIQELDRISNEYNSIQNIKGSRNPQNESESIESKESYFYWTRKAFNCMKSPSILRSAFFIFLNKTCFRGMYREGPYGYNVPFGNYKQSLDFNNENILKLSTLFKNVTFSCQSFLTLDVSNAKGFFYLDPPYVPERKNSFVSYTDSGFSAENHEQFFKFCRQLTENENTFFVMSNSDTKPVSDAFDGLKDIHFERIICRRAINSKDPSASTSELIVVNVVD